MVISGQILSRDWRWNCLQEMLAHVLWNWNGKEASIKMFRSESTDDKLSLCWGCKMQEMQTCRGPWYAFQLSCIYVLQRMSIFGKCLQYFECIILYIIYVPGVATIHYAGVFDELLRFFFLLCFSGKGPFIFFKTPSWLVSCLFLFISLLLCDYCDLESQNYRLFRYEGTAGGLAVPPGNLARPLVFLSSYVIPTTEQGKGEDSGSILTVA